MSKHTLLSRLIGSLALWSVVALFSAGVWAQAPCVPPGSPGTPGPRPAGGDFPRLPGSPGTLTGWPFEPGLLDPGAPNSPLGSPIGLLPTEWDMWWRFNASAHLGLRGHVHRPPYRSGDVISFSSDIDRAQTLAPFFPTAEFAERRVLPELARLLKIEKSAIVKRSLLLALARATRALPVTERASWLALVEVELGSKDRVLAESATVALGLTGHPLAARSLSEVILGTGRATKWFRRGVVPMRTRVQAILSLGRIAAEGNQDVRRFALSQLKPVIVEDVGGVPHARVAALCAAALCAPAWSDAPDAVQRPGTFQYESDRLLELFLDRDLHESIRAQVVATWAAWIAKLDPHERRVEKGRFLPLALGRMRSDVDRKVLEVLVVALGAVVDSDDDALDLRAVEQLLDLDSISAPRNIQARRWMELARIAVRSGDASSSGATRKLVLEHLLDAVLNGHTEERPWAILALGRLGHNLLERGEDIGDPVRQALRIRLNSNAPAAEEAALCLALGMLHDLKSLPVLERLFQNAAQNQVRSFAALGLGFLGELSSLEILGKAQIGRTLANIELETAVTYARALLDDRDVGLHRLAEVKHSVALEAKVAHLIAAGEVADVRGVDLLLAYIEGRKADVLRAAAAGALGRIAEPDLRTGAWRYVTDTSAAPWTTEVLSAIRAR